MSGRRSVIVEAILAGYARQVSAVRESLRFLGHSTALLDLGGARVLTDPVLTMRLGFLHRHTTSVGDVLADANVDVVLISHAHHDHLHLPSLRLVPGAPRVIAPIGLGPLLSSRGHDVVEVRAGDGVSVGSLRVTAIEARHTARRGLFGPLVPALGYLVTSGAARVYFAGDTDLFPEMDDLAGRVDVALIPVWGWGPRLGTGHLDPTRAAEAVRRIRPRLAVPIHWGTFYPYAFARVWPRPLAEPPLAFAREVARVAPRVEVCVLAPGERVDLTSA
jgi:L-ascorbate metabolism protein UlaG (beta-lactamase superfamily)